MRLPQHLAIIMDGNGRWAEQRNLPRIAGHRQGVATVQTIVRECRKLGIGYLTLYAFSSENWRRPGDEVNALMELLGIYLTTELPTLLEENIRLNVIGEISRLPRDVQRTLTETTASTANNDGLVLTLALSYGARDEMLRCVKRLAEDVQAGRLSPSGIEENHIEQLLDTHDLPDPDLLIRTSGEMRISNFLLWQLAYAELYFCETLWPDFDREQLHRALQEYGKRQRRFGLTGAQISGQGPADEEGHH